MSTLTMIIELVTYNAPVLFRF